jgi:hypothetical protein
MHYSRTRTYNTVAHYQTHTTFMSVRCISTNYVTQHITIKFIDWRQQTFVSDYVFFSDYLLKQIVKLLNKRAQNGRFHSSTV